MTHEPECPIPQHPENAVCFCDALRACAARVREEERALICVEQTSLAELSAAYRRAYRRGYNDHARSVQHWQDTHGAYRQHGEGENP